MRELMFSNVQEASNFINNNSDMGFVIFSNVENITELSTLVSSNVILCSTSGEYGRNGYEDGVISGFQYDICDGEVVEILYPPIKSVNNLKGLMKKLKLTRMLFHFYYAMV